MPKFIDDNFVKLYFTRLFPDVDGGGNQVKS